MKKHLLFAVSVLFCAASILKAQTIVSADFESVAIPTGWTQQTLSTDGGWKFGINTALQSGSYPIPAHTNMACTNDDACNCNKSNDKLITSSMDFSAYTHVFLSFDVLYYAGSYQSISETATIDVSTDGGTTWTTLNTLTGNADWTTLVIDLSAYAGQSSVEVAFHYNDGGGWEYGFAIDNVLVYAPAPLDLSTVSQNLPYYIQNNSNNTVSGVITNDGTSTITSMNLNYKINNGAAITDALSSLSIASLASYNFTHNIPWMPTSSGTYTMKIWADNLNGSPDGNNVNDTLTTTFQVLDSLQTKMPLFEEFNQASCDPCAQATPNLDSVLWNCRNICNAVRYHVNWPGTDYMNSQTQTPFVGTVVSYYNVQGVPDAKLDGSTDVYPGTIASSDIQTARAKGSPFKIGLNASYNAVSNTYSVTASVKAYGTMPSGLACKIALTVDTITYAQNQSTESIPQYVFPQVAEDMMPGAAGTTLTAFTSGQTQTVNASWVKNHTWGASPQTWTYDSTFVHVTAWVQDNSSQYIYQSATAIPAILTGINQLSSNSSIAVYPNPCHDFATIAITLKEEQNVKLEVYNMLGEQVYSIAQNKLNAGTAHTSIDVSAFKSGVYFVKLYSGDETHTQKLVVNK